MKIVESNAITLMLGHYSLSIDSGDLGASAYESCFIVINWSRQLETYPAWVHTVKQQTPATVAYTCINFPKGGVTITPNECEWGMEEGLEGYKMCSMNADDVRHMTSCLFQGVDHWDECVCIKPRKHFVDLIMSVLDDTNAQRVFTSRKLKLLEKHIHALNPQGLEVYARGCVSGLIDLEDMDWKPLEAHST
jgi:hypothetical protein